MENSSDSGPFYDLWKEFEKGFTANFASLGMSPEQEEVVRVTIRQVFYAGAFSIGMLVGRCVQELAPTESSVLVRTETQKIADYIDKVFPVDTPVNPALTIKKKDDIV